MKTFGEEVVVVEQSGAIGRPTHQFVNPALLYVSMLQEGNNQKNLQINTAKKK